MPNFQIPSDPKDAMHIVCLYLAQSGEPHVDLGYSTQSEAFAEVGDLFSSPANNVKNNRDSFDRLTGSTRIGWQKELRPALQRIYDDYSGLDRANLLALSKDILNKNWRDEQPFESIENDVTKNLSSTESNVTMPDFAQEVVDGFEIPKFQLISESYATTWGFVNGAGRTFKLSNNDLAKALNEILDAWEDWVANRLNYNSINPDESLTAFAAKHFSTGAHQVLANDQRRGFLHFISSVAYTASHHAPFGLEESSTPLKRADYEAALQVVSDIQKRSKEVSIENQSIAQPEVAAGIARVKGGENVIYYGAPGTGKSYAINEVVKSRKNVVRTVFHPDLQNSDFFGGLKPRMRDGELCYDFVPGPFMEALKLAHCNPGEMVYLVIEELNRAAAAAVFGDLFLLLDRDDNGNGVYDVSFPTVESREWFETATSQTSGKLRLPSNLTIYATMNSADQGVFPLDTAFRRRWRQEYMHLDYKAGPDGNLRIIGSDKQIHEVEWRKFVKCLNSHLLKQDDLALAEDRLLGQWFVKPADLEGTEIPGKVLLYLWDDLLRHGGRDRIFRPEFKTYGGLVQAIGSGPIFCDDFLNALDLQTKATTEDESPA